MYQQPEADLKDNFPLGTRQPLLKTAAIACVAPKAGEDASDTTADVTQIRAKPEENAAVTAELKRNALVAVKAREGPWALIAPCGAEAGYVRYSILEPVN